MTLATLAERPINPIDVSQDALYFENTWREPFAKLRAEMPLSWRAESPFGAYWSAVSHELVQEVELRHEVFSSRWDLGNITIAEDVGGEGFPNFIAQDPPIHTAQRKVIAPAFSHSQMLKLDAKVRERTVQLVDGLPMGETFDWVEWVSIPQTLGMLSLLFDMPFEEWRDIKRWSDWASGVSAEHLTDEYRAIHGRDGRNAGPFRSRTQRPSGQTAKRRPAGNAVVARRPNPEMRSRQGKIRVGSAI